MILSLSLSLARVKLYIGSTVFVSKSVNSVCCVRKKPETHHSGLVTMTMKSNRVKLLKPRNSNDVAG